VPRVFRDLQIAEGDCRRASNVKRVTELSFIYLHFDWKLLPLCDNLLGN
jgi:hypothetical protein